MSDPLTPWWVASATGVVTALAGAVAKVWSEHRREIRELRDELAAANARVVELQTAEHQEHVRDLRRFAGISTSGSPPPDGWPPPVVRKR